MDWEGLRRRLPPDFKLTVTALHVDAECVRCGRIVQVWRREKATAEEVLAAARGHRCPAKG